RCAVVDPWVSRRGSDSYRPRPPRLACELRSYGCVRRAALIKRWTVGGDQGAANFKIQGDHDGEPRESSLRSTSTAGRSEERRVGKESRWRWARSSEEKTRADHS